MFFFCVTIIVKLISNQDSCLGLIPRASFCLFEKSNNVKTTCTKRWKSSFNENFRCLLHLVWPRTGRQRRCPPSRSRLPPSPSRRPPSRPQLNWNGKPLKVSQTGRLKSKRCRKTKFRDVSGYFDATASRSLSPHGEIAPIRPGLPPVSCRGDPNHLVSTINRFRLKHPAGHGAIGAYSRHGTLRKPINIQMAPIKRSK